MTITNYATKDFSFSICPTRYTDEGKEMKKRMCISVIVVDCEGKPESSSLCMEAAIKRICDAMLGGSAGLGASWFDANDGFDKDDAAYLDWHTSVDMDRLGVHPHLHRACADLPGGEVQTLFYRITSEGLVDDSDGDNEKAMEKSQ